MIRPERTAESLRSRLNAPRAVSFPESLRTALSAGLAIFMTGLVSGQFLDGVGLMTLMASMGPSAVILFAVPHSPMASPWAMVGGHLLSGAIGVSSAQLIADPWIAGGTAVGLSIFVMNLTRCLHPPGGATTLVAALGDEGVKALGFQFLLTPLALNMLVLLILAQLLNRLHRSRSAIDMKPSPRRPAERLDVRSEDLQAALRDMDAFVDASDEELSRIYRLAALHAFQREFGGVDCARIMSPDVLAVEFGTDLDDAWRLMQTQGVEALPVIDRGRHVIGIITLSEFVRHADVVEFDGMGGKLRRLIRKTPGLSATKPEVAGQIMRSPVTTLRQDAPLIELAPLLGGGGIHQVPIVDERDKLVGLVSQSDLIVALYRMHAGDAAVVAPATEEP